MIGDKMDECETPAFEAADMAGGAAKGACSWQDVRRAIGNLAKDRGEWAGLPTPIEEAALVVAKGHPYEYMTGFKLGDPKSLERIREGKPSDVSDDGSVLVNVWHDRLRRRDIYIFRDATGKLEWGWLPQGPAQRLDAILLCLGIATTMDYAAEERALETLRALIKPHLFDAYRMTGAFIETSKRSGVTYVFRRLATTIAMKPQQDVMKFLAALCLHPIGYYDGLPMGVMTPTDDVIAHLTMMRADEHLFWRKSNQHDIESQGAQL